MFSVTERKVVGVVLFFNTNPLPDQVCARSNNLAHPIAICHREPRPYRWFRSNKFHFLSAWIFGTCPVQQPWDDPLTLSTFFSRIASTAKFILNFTFLSSLRSGRQQWSQVCGINQTSVDNDNAPLPPSFYGIAQASSPRRFDCNALVSTQAWIWYSEAAMS